VLLDKVPPQARDEAARAEATALEGVVASGPEPTRAAS
jgi:hypothetical protein